MQVILDSKLYNELWDRIYSEYSFTPSMQSNCGAWLKPPVPFRRYRLNFPWEEPQEQLVNEALCTAVRGEMYALDWKHDGFVFSPQEKIPFGYCYYDGERDCNVYFPEYYPDGDYHFFVTCDWTFGLFGHPWRKELIVMGTELIREIEKHRKALGLSRIIF